MQAEDLLVFLDDTPTTETYTLSLHDALPISDLVQHAAPDRGLVGRLRQRPVDDGEPGPAALHRLGRVGDEGAVLAVGGAGSSEEHTSALQSRPYLVCPLLLATKTLVASRTST